MSIKAQVRTDALGNITIHMEGGLDYINSSSLRSKLSELATENPHSEIVLNLNALDFVGSSGIGHFVETLNALNAKKDQIKLTNVSSEFMKVFKLYNLNALEAMIVDFERDDETETLATRYANRKQTYQN